MRAAILFVCALAVSAQDDRLAGAVAAFRRGDLSTAERVLRGELAAHPENVDALGVLGVVLDQQKRFEEAGRVYRRALALDPRSLALLNNYGNHLMAVGKPAEARDQFEKALALDPAHVNANAQMARLAMERKLPADALRYLERLPDNAQQTPDLQILRLQALYALHRNAEAGEILERLSADANGDKRRSYTLGIALASVGQYAKAEDLFSRAVAADPEDFDSLYHLGLAASHAGHNERARDILQAAMRKQPNSPDVLYDLAAVNATLGQREAALTLLAEAARVAPQRADVQQLLARTAADLGGFGDAVQAWDRYLRIVPSDEAAKRERAFALTANGEDMVTAVATLKAYVARHPSDAVGRYELGLAEATSAPDEAFEQLARALELKPDLSAAHVARGLMRLKAGDFAAALPDLEGAERREPENAMLLDRLGQTYMALERHVDAVRVLRRAAELSPRDSKTLMHFGRALTAAGQEREAAAVFARFRELGPDRSSLPRQAGLVDFLSLSPEEQQKRYRAGVERTVEKDPANAEAQVRYLKLLLADGKPDAAAETARRILALKPSSTLLSEAGHALVAAGQYGIARDFLEKAVLLRPSGDFQLDLAIATWHAVNAGAGLEILDRAPGPKRGGDYDVARAAMLEAAGRPESAAAALNQALHSNPTQVDLYRYAVSFLLAHQRSSDALTLLDRALQTLPDDPNIQLLRVVALVANGRIPDAKQSLAVIENRWPDWYNLWLANAVILGWEGQQERSTKALETAIALGADKSDSLQPETPTATTAAERALVLLRAVFP